MKQIIGSTCGCDIYIETDSRGSSESYLPYMFVAYSSGLGKKASVVWSEGIRKDTTKLIPFYRDAAEKLKQSLSIA